MTNKHSQNHTISQTFKSLTEKLRTIDVPSLIQKLKQHNSRKSISSGSPEGIKTSSLLMGYTKGYADFLPNQSWQWFSSVN